MFSYKREKSVHARKIYAGVLTLLFLCAAVPGIARGENHITEFNALRDSMIELGSGMPDMIKNADQAHVRTLERVFEINTFALSSLEAYFKMLNIVVLSKGAFNAEVVRLLNRWLEFIEKFSKKDIDYFEEALAQTKDQAVGAVIKKARANIGTLGEIAQKATKENIQLIEEAPSR